jgi:hypothetical protein
MFLKESELLEYMKEHEDGSFIFLIDKYADDSHHADKMYYVRHLEENKAIKKSFNEEKLKIRN